MVAIKSHLANRFLDNPDQQIAAFLFYGTDPGQISERSQYLGRQLARRETPEGELVRLDDADLDVDRDRLGVELRTLPMFGGRKIVRVTTGRIINAAMLKDLVESDDLAGILIVEGGNLKPTDSLRATFEKAPKAAAIACYGDEARDIDGLISEVLQAHSLGITREARQLLTDRLGADRALSRGEIEKLALYSLGRPEIDSDDVEAIVGDASEMAVDRIIMTATAGDAGGAINELSRVVMAGESPQSAIAALQRHLLRLHRVRSDVDAGASIEEALRHLRPPVHFKQKDAFAAQVRRWSRTELDRAIAAAADGLKSARLSANLEDVVAERLLLAVASLARAR